MSDARLISISSGPLDAGLRAAVTGWFNYMRGRRRQPKNVARIATGISAGVDFRRRSTCYARGMPDPQTPCTAEAYAQLLSLAVHELRTPASVVAGYLRMLQRDTSAPLNERQQRIVDEASKSCARIVSLITELSDISKLDGGLVTFQTERFDLFPLLLEVAADVHTAEDRGVGLEVCGTGTGATVAGDRARIRTALSAFLRAVLREQPAVCTVVADRRLETESGRTSAVVVISKADDVQRLYEARRVSFDEKRGGLGLALPIARRIVERHGGHVWSPAAEDAANAAENRSAVIVSLPLSEQNR